MSNLDAAEKAIAALDLGEEYAALVELVRTLARSLDVGGCAECGTSDANIAREYRQALKHLAEAGVGGDDDGAAAFLTLVRTPSRAEVGDFS